MTIDERLPAPAPDSAVPATSRTRVSRTRRAAGWNLVPSVLGVVGAVLCAIHPAVPVVPAVVVLLAWLVVPGEALARLVPGPRRVSTRAVQIAVSGAVLACVIGLPMIWSGFWHPRAAVVIVLLIGAVLVLVRPLPVPSAEAFARSTRNALASTRPVPALVIVAALAVAVVAMLNTDTAALGDWGLLPVLPAYWYVAVAAVLAVMLLELGRAKSSSVVVTGGLLGLIVVLYGSANFIESAPRYGYVFKHIAVTRLFEATGHTSPAVDLYNRWPGFFASSAFLGDATGVTNPVDYARFAEPVFALVTAALVVLIARTLGAPRRAALTAALVFTVGDWVGQGYYSPQAFAFSLYLVVVLLALHALRAAPVGWFARREEGLRRRFAKGAPETAAMPIAVGRRWPSIAAMLIVFACITASHQLTPYIALLTLVPLFLFGYLRPRWVALALIATTLLYLLPNLDFVETRWGLFSGFDIFQNATYTPADAVKYSDAGVWQGRIVDVLTALVVVLGIAGMIRHLRRGHVRTTIVVAWLGFAPVLSLAVQSYGGEGRFRALLFALPSFSIAVSWLFWDGRPKRRTKAWLAVAVVAMTALFTAAYLQPEAQNRVDTDHVAAAEWLDGTVRDGDLVAGNAFQYPTLIGPHYAAQLTHAYESQELALYLGTSKDVPTITRIEDAIEALRHGDAAYLQFSDANAGNATGVQEVQRRWDAVEAEVRASPSFSRVYSAGTVRIYRYIG